MMKIQATANRHSAQIYAEMLGYPGFVEIMDNEYQEVTHLPKHHDHLL